MMIVDIFDIIQQVRDTLYCAMALLSYIITIAIIILSNYVPVLLCFWLVLVVVCTTMFLCV